MCLVIGVVIVSFCSGCGGSGLRGIAGVIIFEALHWNNLIYLRNVDLFCRSVPYPTSMATFVGILPVSAETFHGMHQFLFALYRRLLFKPWQRLFLHSPSSNCLGSAWTF